MTDNFEEWLKQKIKSNKVVLGRGNKTWGRFEAFTESLEKYREFLNGSFKLSLQQSNHNLGCELEAIASVLEFRKLDGEAETLRRIAGDLK